MTKGSWLEPSTVPGQSSNATSLLWSPTSIKAAFIALDGSTAFLTYFSVEIVIEWFICLAQNAHTKKKTNKQRKPKLIFLFLYLPFGHMLPK